MKSEIFDAIAEYASRNYEDTLLNSQEYSEFKQNILELQEDINRLNLPEREMQLVKRLLKEHHDLSLDYVEWIYKQAMTDCVILLKELKVIS